MPPRSSKSDKIQDMQQDPHEENANARQGFFAHTSDLRILGRGSFLFKWSFLGSLLWAYNPYKNNHQNLTWNPKMKGVEDHFPFQNR